jgi:chromosome segregation ATPase
MQDKLTVDHAARGTAKRISELRKLIADQEAELAQVENHVAHSNVEASDLEAQLEELRKEEVSLDAKAKELAVMVEQAQKDTRRNYTTIERKQAQVDQLNRKCDSLRTKMAAESAGKEDVTPSMIEVASYRHDITTVTDENDELQQQWLSQQSRLVAMEKELEERTEASDEMRTKHSVLMEQQRRLDGEITAKRKEAEQQERLFRQLQNELLKLNRLVTRNRGVQQELQQANVLLETDYLRQLKTEERECADMQMRLEALQEERERLLNAVIEAEEQMLLWEKKITLARETKAELKSNEGKEELDGMRAEIHRMELRMTQLERQKEELISEMERSVERREHIGTKARLAAKKPVDMAHNVKKEVADLQRKVQQATKDAKQFESHIAVVTQEQDEVKMRIEETRGTSAQAREARGQVEAQLNAGQRAKVRNLDDLVHYQAMAKHFQAAEVRKLKLKFKVRSEG